MNLGMMLLLSISDSRKDGCGSMDALVLRITPQCLGILLALYALSRCSLRKIVKRGQ